LFSDLNVSEEQIIDQLAWELERHVYMGDAFPWVNMCCSGAGVLAALTGATLHPESYDDIWFRVDDVKPISQLHIAFDHQNAWLKRLLKIGMLVLERWEGRVLVSMPDIGGVLDVLSSFRPAEALLYDLYDEPQEVLRVIGEIETAWHACYDLFSGQMSPVNPGYTAWAGIYSDVPYYMMQCDFCYMISPEMFDQFVKPTLMRTSEKLGRAFYHLDGKGQLPHLESLLQIPTLNGVQWIPGDGNKPTGQWPEVFETILASGKHAQIMGDPSQLLSIMTQTQRCKNMTTGHWHTKDRAQAEHYLQALMHSCHTDSTAR
jgi:5-methyltetrahydrofolate--homocysteine methyltransferase